MKNFKKLSILICLIFVVNSCSKEDNSANKDSTSGFKIYKSKSVETDLVISGQDVEFNYACFGGFKSTSDPNVFIPRNIRFVKQEFKNKDEVIIIKIDENYLPQFFYKILNGVESDTVYKVVYDKNKTTIYHDVRDNSGIFVTAVTSVLEGITPTSKTSRVLNFTGRDEDECFPFEEAGEFDICRDNNVIKEYGEEWEKNSFVPIKHVGKFISWIMDVAKDNICSNQKEFKLSNSKNNNSIITFSCDNYDENLGEIDNICDGLVSCELNWYYTCYGVYDDWGFYLYDECFWEYY